MRHMRAVGLLGALALAGCAGTWKKPGATAADLDRELEECRAAAREEVEHRETYQAEPSTRLEERMEDRTREDRQAYVDLCLQARGWHWED